MRPPRPATYELRYTGPTDVASQLIVVNVLAPNTWADLGTFLETVDLEAIETMPEWFTLAGEASDSGGGVPGPPVRIDVPAGTVGPVCVTGAWPDLVFTPGDPIEFSRVATLRRGQHPDPRIRIGRVTAHLGERLRRASLMGHRVGIAAGSVQDVRQMILDGRLQMPITDAPARRHRLLTVAERRVQRSRRTLSRSRDRRVSRSGRSGRDPSRRRPGRS